MYQSIIINKNTEIDHDSPPPKIAWTEMRYGGIPFWTNAHGLAPEGEGDWFSDSETDFPYGTSEGFDGTDGY